ncbi:MAG: putative AAA+ superfamily ATPase, partial [Salibacteraceae bacterium]
MLTNSQSNQILLLANLAFGKSYLTRATLNSYDKSENIQIIVSGKNEEVLGFSVVMVLRPEEFSKYLFLNLESSTDQE